MLFFKKILFLGIFICFASTLSMSAQTSSLEDYARISNKFSKETSGVIKSRIHEDVFWILDDSGNDDRIYAVKRNGNPFAGKDYKGQKIKGAKNRDWEDILVDDQGHIIIADIGNNCKCRNDLTLYVLNETLPEDEKNTVIQEIRFTYPPIETMGIRRNVNFDAEAAFYFKENIYLLTKHGWLDRKSRLYKVPVIDSSYADIELEFVEEIRIDGSVTAADYDNTNKRLAILTYTSVWVYETGEDGSLFGGKAFRKSIKADQVESITFDGNDLIIVDEKKGKMYEISISELEYVDL